MIVLLNPTTKLLALISIAALTACTAPSPTPDNGDVNVYSARHYDIDNDLYEKFTQETGITINLVEGSSDELLERLKKEGANSPADVFMTVDAGRLWRAEEAGILQPTESELLEAKVPESLRHPEGLWFSLTQRARVLVYNVDRVDPDELSTYEALAEPEWAGRVCVRSSTNIYNQSLLGSMIETEGEKAAETWAQGLVKNFAQQPEGGDVNQIKAVAAGQCDVAIANHYYWVRLAKSDDPQDQEITQQTAVFFPNQGDRGTHVNVSGVGIVANAPNPENARKFLEFLVSEEAQTVFAAGNNEYPVVEGIDVDPLVSELGDFKRDTVNVAAYGQHNL
ncbi:MAG: Fe(3+) ABC transporter substrate-binding protein, partial [Spirulina sp. SIO3F2]|nr:Fe(3+) ABC transporter substrate-binding protein [Spirulina sp. SIO3F2]